MLLLFFLEKIKNGNQIIKRNKQQTNIQIKQTITNLLKNLKF